jgi:quinoprotein glucose dehydrogenase
LQCAVSQQDHKSWQDYAGGPDNSRFVDMSQITKANVAQLTVAWSYPTNDTTSYFFNPIIVGNVMYVLARGNSLVALDATTGKEIWVHEHLPTISYRGINYWESKDHKDRRLIFQINHYIEEIDASTGKSILTFGNKGLVDLRAGLGRDPNTVSQAKTSTPGKIYGDLLLLGSAPGEGYMSPPGDLRAYNVLTGKIEWTFHTVPHPGEPGYDTWPKDAWKYEGGANDWGEMALDDKAGIAYFVTGAPTYDLYGGDRVGQDLYGDCLLAINARTGKLIWYFQDVHHDLWDYDICAAPQLITIHHGGKVVQAVAIAGKTGYLYVFDRTTGKPIWPIEERPVPKSDVPGEQAWPTQPIPTAPPPFSLHKFTSADIDPYYLTPEEQAQWKTRIDNADNKGFFTPPSFYKEEIEIPGAWGGANWGSTSSNPSKGLVFVLYDNLPSIVPKVAPRSAGSAGGNSNNGPALYASNCAACHGADRKGGAGPALTDMTRYDRDTFMHLVSAGQGEMPGSNLTSTQLTQLFTYLTNPAGGGYGYGMNQEPTKSLGGPVVASGGAPGGLVQDFNRADSAARYPGGPPYPDGVQAPLRMYSDYGLSYPFVIGPPWSGLAAYDLNKGTIIWNASVGNDPDAVKAGAKGDIGVIEGGLRRSDVATSTGLIFVPCADGVLRAYDQDTGKVLWSYQTPTALVGGPSIYMANGREYLVVSATATKTWGKLGVWASRPSGPDVSKLAWIVFALPQ